MKTELTAENVHNTFMNCLFKEGEPTCNHIIAEGIMVKVGFHPDRLKEYETTIVQMLDGLSDNFKKSGGGGHSFLSMCEDKNGTQWADLHQTMDELVALGIATKKLSYVMPREMWNMLPGGMPYVVIN